MRAASNV